MITRNFYSYYLAGRTSARPVVTCVDGSESVYAGYVVSYAPTAADKNLSTESLGNGVFAIFVGSGTTPTTFDTTKLESEVTTLTPSNHVIINTPIPGWSFEKGLFTISRTFVNGTTNPITVSEAILVLGSSSYMAAVLARDVFTPIVVNPGEAVSISFNVK